MKIVPAILAKTEREFIRQLRIFERYFKLVQLDIMDDKFVANKTFKCFKSISRIKTPANYELHLMVAKPLSYVKRWIKNKKVKRIIFHLEAVKPTEIKDIIDLIKQHKLEAGIALNPKTPIGKIKNWLPDLNYVLLMSVNPGFSGQKFNPIVYRKIQALRKLNKKITIGIDGGVNDKNASKLIKAGANNLNVAGYLIYSKDLKSSIKQLHNS